MAAPAKEQGFFDGIDTSYSGLFTTLGRRSPDGAADAARPRSTARSDAAAADFKLTDPSAAVPALAAALQFTREAIAKSAGEDEALFLLRIKERQFQDAITARLGLELDRHRAAGRRRRADRPVRGLRAAAVDGGAGSRARPSRCGPAWPIAARLAVAPTEIALETGPGWTATPAGDTGIAPSVDGQRRVLARRFTVTVAADAPLSTRPYFHAPALQESRYTLADAAAFGRPASAPPLVAVARYAVEGVAGDGARGRPPARGQAALRRRPARGAQSCRALARDGVADRPRSCRWPPRPSESTLQVDVLQQRRGADAPGSSR